MSMRLPSPFVRYGLPLASTGFISLLFYLINSNDRNTDLRCFAFAVAILLSGLLGGVGPGLLATGLSAFANVYLFFPPIFSLHIASQERVAALVLLTGDGILLSFIGSRFRDSRTADVERSWTRYLPPLLFVSTAAGIKLLAFNSLGQQTPFVLFYTAVLASALTGGFGPGLLATFLASMIARYFFLDPKYSFSVSSVMNAERVLLFIAEGIFLSCIGGGISRSAPSRYSRCANPATGLGVQELRELRQLREENGRLKRLAADLSLDRQILQEIVSKKL